MGARRTLIKTQDYLDVFARFKQKENIEAVERMLTSKTELELFERSQLGTPCLAFHHSRRLVDRWNRGLMCLLSSSD